MNKILKKIGKIIVLPVRYILNKLFLNAIYTRLADLEYRSFNRRFYAIHQTTDYLIGAKIPGDYLEFGVFEGTTFRYAYSQMSPYFRSMKFIAFDSFEGLPITKGIDAENGYSSNFHKNEFACTEEEFLENLVESKVDLQRTLIVKGWFDDTLRLKKAKDYGLEKIAVSWIDCDLYESTVPVLKFITPYLSIGSVIIFDDWRCFRNHPDYGEQRACREWLAENPKIVLNELFSFGWNGIAFTVTSC